VVRIEKTDHQITVTENRLFGFIVSSVIGNSFLAFTIYLAINGLTHCDSPHNLPIVILVWAAMNAGLFFGNYRITIRADLRSKQFVFRKDRVFRDNHEESIFLGDVDSISSERSLWEQSGHLIAQTKGGPLKMLLTDISGANHAADELNEFLRRFRRDPSPKIVPTMESIEDLESSKDTTIPWQTKLITAFVGLSLSSMFYGKIYPQFKNRPFVHGLLVCALLVGITYFSFAISWYMLIHRPDRKPPDTVRPSIHFALSVGTLIVIIILLVVQGVLKP